MGSSSSGRDNFRHVLEDQCTMHCCKIDAVHGCMRCWAAQLKEPRYGLDSIVGLLKEVYSDSIDSLLYGVGNPFITRIKKK